MNPVAKQSEFKEKGCVKRKDNASRSSHLLQLHEKVFRWKRGPWFSCVFLESTSTPRVAKACATGSALIRLQRDTNLTCLIGARMCSIFFGPLRSLMCTNPAAKVHVVLDDERNTSREEARRRRDLSRHSDHRHGLDGAVASHVAQVRQHRSVPDSPTLRTAGADTTGCSARKCSRQNGADQRSEGTLCIRTSSSAMRGQ